MKNVAFWVMSICRSVARCGLILGLLTFGGVASAEDHGVTNPNFEEGAIGQVPLGWFLPAPCREAGYRIQLSEEHPKQARFDAVGAANAANELARPLQGRALDNLVAFTRLLGYVRYFHPSDQAAAINWDEFAIDGVRAVENAKDPEALAQILQRQFGPIAPSVCIFPTATQPADRRAARPESPNAKSGEARPTQRKILVWRHLGVGLGGSPVYSSQRVDLHSAQPTFGPKLPKVPLPDPHNPYTVDLGGGVSCLVPIALDADENGTLPRRNVGPPGQNEEKANSLTPPQPSGLQSSGNDRDTRLAAVTLAWNVFQHFYPYFDVVEVDWPGELRRALLQAAEDTDDRAFLKTLRRLVAALRDGHGGVYMPTATGPASFPPFGWDWVEDQLVITGITDPGREATGLKPGDLVVEINGKPAKALLAAQETEISGATAESRRNGALVAVAGGLRDSEMAIKIQPWSKESRGNIETRSVHVRRTLDPTRFLSLHEQRPAKIATIKPGVIYADLSRINQQEFDGLVPQLVEARGIVFDLRGYPQGISPQTIGHLTDQPVTCAQWHVPVTYWPDRRNVAFQFSNWSVQPEAPRFRGKVAFLTDARAISYAETYLAIIEHYKLAEIVGAPTAGTNGNVNPFVLPGGYRVSWTGMKVLKHDGSRHHGMGIRPTVPAIRTIRGIAEGRDEVLDQAVVTLNLEP